MTKQSSTEPIMTVEELTAMMMAIISKHCRDIRPKLAPTASHDVTPQEMWEADCIRRSIGSSKRPTKQHSGASSDFVRGNGHVRPARRKL